MDIISLKRSLKAKLLYLYNFRTSTTMEVWSEKKALCTILSIRDFLGFENNEGTDVIELIDYSSNTIKQTVKKIHIGNNIDETLKFWSTLSDRSAEKMARLFSRNHFAETQLTPWSLLKISTFIQPITISFASLINDTPTRISFLRLLNLYEDHPRRQPQHAHKNIYWKTGQVTATGPMSVLATERPWTAIDAFCERSDKQSLTVNVTCLFDVTPSVVVQTMNTLLTDVVTPTLKAAIRKISPLVISGNISESWCYNESVFIVSEACADDTIVNVDYPDEVYGHSVARLFQYTGNQEAQDEVLQRYSAWAAAYKMRLKVSKTENIKKLRKALVKVRKVLKTEFGDHSTIKSIKQSVQPTVDEKYFNFKSLTKSDRHRSLKVCAFHIVDLICNCIPKSMEMHYIYSVTSDTISSIQRYVSTTFLSHVSLTGLPLLKTVKLIELIFNKRIKKEFDPDNVKLLSSRYMGPETIYNYGLFLMKSKLDHLRQTNTVLYNLRTFIEISDCEQDKIAAMAFGIKYMVVFKELHKCYDNSKIIYRQFILTNPDVKKDIDTLKRKLYCWDINDTSISNECPVCWNKFPRLWSRCTNGHGVCGQCLRQMKSSSCCICRTGDFPHSHALVAVTDQSSN